MLIHRHESCIGIPLFKWNQYYVEIWMCPIGYRITPHSHPEEDIELMYICGDVIFCKTRDIMQELKHFRPRWYHVFQTFSVPAGTVHWFDVSQRFPLVFINFSKFKKGHKAKSASKDFQL